MRRPVLCSRRRPSRASQQLRTREEHQCKDLGWIHIGHLLLKSRCTYAIVEPAGKSTVASALQATHGHKYVPSSGTVQTLAFSHCRVSPAPKTKPAQRPPLFSSLKLCGTPHTHCSNHVDAKQPTRLIPRVPPPSSHTSRPRSTANQPRHSPTVLLVLLAWPPKRRRIDTRLV
ncbi:hypothetical protein BD289DRAFT_184474 [Coniella lustricola]|uniref:Uncharacterized protein n=1 Tax=Coniella lustricola TaxID=2025994 RepID=A0A2T3ADA7_9PEZI|nr:hypothetical protein BD289DRAFT_184474 [Coniella lustricola]